MYWVRKLGRAVGMRGILCDNFRPLQECAWNWKMPSWLFLVHYSTKAV